MSTPITADYVVIGAGAMGMAFTDTLITETDASVVLIDRHQQPGGHWTTAYPFVRLHQPSSFYGVNSRVLGSDRIDEVGTNQGLFELASGAEVCAYFDQLMRQQFLPSGRVTWLPMCEHVGAGRVRSLVANAEYAVTARRRVVDATYMRVTVPSMRKPPFSVADGVTCVPLNALPRLGFRPRSYTVIGAGKTGMDACLWLLQHDVDADAITWIMPRDSWLLDRARIQPGQQFMSAINAGQVAQARAIAEATSTDDLFDRLEACGQLLRLDPEHRPRMYRCATVTQTELELLRRIRHVVRQGHVKAITSEALVLEEGRLPVATDSVFVDCTADGLQRRPPLPVFAPGSITLQSVRTCQQVFSAAFIAHVEAAYDDDAIRNDLCAPVPHPDSDLDWLRTAIDSRRNEMRWADDERLQAWLRGARLQSFRNLSGPPPADAEARAAAKEQMRAGTLTQRAQLGKLLAAGAS